MRKSSLSSGYPGRVLMLRRISGSEQFHVLSKILSDQQLQGLLQDEEYCRRLCGLSALRPCLHTNLSEDHPLPEIDLR